MGDVQELGSAKFQLEKHLKRFRMAVPVRGRLECNAEENWFSSPWALSPLTHEDDLVGCVVKCPATR
jgi:hypothetical protein